jgi:rhodanese-related sulfurtransferase
MSAVGHFRRNAIRIVDIDLPVLYSLEHCFYHLGTIMTAEIDARSLKAWLSDGDEIALLDISEHGQYGAGHPFFATPLPYSRFELRLPALVPNQGVRIVLCDEGDGVAVRAARRAAALGYRNLHVLAGGKEAWSAAGCTLFDGVNVPSKAFGELIEHARGTPHISPQTVEAMRVAKEDFVIVDGRPFFEFHKMCIPGGICCPNGELVLRIKEIVPDPKTTIVVNCAGRTRSIIGAQTLLDFGMPNPVYALENGTQGWLLAGLTLEHGAERRYGDAKALSNSRTLQARAHEFGVKRGAAFVSATIAAAWLGDPARTTYLLDVRTAEEVAAQPMAGLVHAPGGQLIQATDHWIGVKGARIILVDAEEVRAPVVAGWLRQLGHEAYVLDGGIAAAAELASLQATQVAPLPLPMPISVGETAAAIGKGAVQLIDLRPSMTFRQGHIAPAIWSIRPRITAAVRTGAETTVLIAEEPELAALAALDLREAGVSNIRLLAGNNIKAWREDGLPIAATPADPCDADCIDFLFFARDRHDGNAAAARQYLAWETGLIDRLDAQERGMFRILSGS